jgi:hypothetical protein
LIDTDNEPSSSPPFKQQQQESGSIELLKKTQKKFSCFSDSEKGSPLRVPSDEQKPVFALTTMTKEKSPTVSIKRDSQNSTPSLQQKTSKKSTTYDR